MLQECARQGMRGLGIAHEQRQMHPTTWGCIDVGSLHGGRHGWGHGGRSAGRMHGGDQELQLLLCRELAGACWPGRGCQCATCLCCTIDSAISSMAQAAAVRQSACCGSASGQHIKYHDRSAGPAHCAGWLSFGSPTQQWEGGWLDRQLLTELDRTWHTALHSTTHSRRGGFTC